MTQANGSDPDAAGEAAALPHYRLIQLEWNARRGLFNDAVPNFEELVTHHPHSNRNATIQNGVVTGGEPGRRHGMVGGEIQEIEVATPQNAYGLGPDHARLVSAPCGVTLGRLGLIAPGVAAHTPRLAADRARRAIGVADRSHALTLAVLQLDHNAFVQTQFLIASHQRNLPTSGMVLHVEIEAAQTLLSAI